METVELNFSRDEYEARLAKARVSMAEKGIDLFIRDRTVQYGMADRL